MDFLSRIRQGTLTQLESTTHVALMTTTIHLREISDIINDELLGVARAAVERPAIRIEPAMLSEFYGRVQQAVQLAVTAVSRTDGEASAKVLALSGEVRQLGEALLSKLAEAFNAADPHASATLRLQTTFVNALRQTFTLTKRIARNACAPTDQIAESGP